jgi:hypothetical protein
MVKAVINMGYNEYIMDLPDAITVLELLDKAERYKSKYNSRTDDRASFTSYHVYAQEDEAALRNITLLSADAYRKAKLLGKPDDN